MIFAPPKLTNHRPRQALVVSLSSVLIFCASCILAYGQEKLIVSPSFNPDSPQTPETIIEFRLSRELLPQEGHVAILIGRSDVTSLFVVDGKRLVYSPGLVPLPSGESELTIFLVSNDNRWVELRSFQLRVIPEPKPPPQSVRAELQTISTHTNGANLQPNGIGTASAENSTTNAGTAAIQTAGPETTKPTEPAARHQPWGFDVLKYVPSLTLAIKSQPAQTNFPANTRPSERATFTDGTLQFSLRGQMQRGWFGSETQFDFAGSTFQGEALRFGTLANRAPQIDLSSYLVQFKLGRAKVAIGHTAFGSSRHLINNFASRGITITVPITKRFDFSVGALNGTNIVGYGNFLGLGRSKHQLQSATMGVELLPKRPGGLRLEFSGISAYIQALNNFSQGSVNDVERSKGGSVRLIATDKAGRFRFDGAFTRSQYRNPADPLLYQGTNTVAVPFLTRNARYLDVSYDVLRGVKLTKSKQLNLGIAFRHEQVDPLYKSLGASAGADRSQNDFQLTGSVGEISVQVGHGRFNDNLRRIASILQSLSRSNQFSVALPAAALWGGTSSTSKYLPRLAYSRSIIHQFGAALPINGGFALDRGSVPNQYATSQNFNADWQFQKFTLGVGYSRSFSNNEQRGREHSDFLNQTNGVRASFNPTSKLAFNFELTRDSANDLEAAKLSRTWRVGPTVSWTLTKQMTWTATLFNTIAGDRAQTNGSRNTEFDTQFSYRVGLDRGELKKVQTQMFVRYADRYARSRDSVFGSFNLTRAKIFSAGVNVTIF